MTTAVTKLTPIPTPTGSFNSVALGQLGADYLDDTGDYTGTWAAITILSDATFTTLTSTTIFINGATTVGNLAKTILKGITIYGHFTEINLSAGAVIAYRS